MLEQRAPALHSCTPTAAPRATRHPSTLSATVQLPLAILISRRGSVDVAAARRLAERKTSSWSSSFASVALASSIAAVLSSFRSLRTSQASSARSPTAFGHGPRAVSRLSRVPGLHPLDGRGESGGSGAYSRREPVPGRRRSLAWRICFSAGRASRARRRLSVDDASFAGADRGPVEALRG